MHLLVGIAEGQGPAATSLHASGHQSLREVVTADKTGLASGASYLHMQAQGAARSLAESQGEVTGPEHLLVALIDQATPEVLEVLRRAGIDSARARRAVLGSLGLSVDLAPVPLPALTPRGTSDRPPLPVSDLDPRAWRALCWRQEHLPLRRLHRRSQGEALRSSEVAACWRVASRLALDDDQRYSLAHHHESRVEELIDTARPGLVERRFPRPTARTGVVAELRRGRPLPSYRRFRRRWLGFTVGWGCWFSNRWVGLRDRWFWLRTLPDYRGAPQP